MTDLLRHKNDGEKQLLVWGASGHAAVVADIAELTGWTPIAFVDDSNQPRTSTSYCGRPVVDREAARALIDAGCRSAAVAIGHPLVRREKSLILESLGCVLPTLIHPSATIAASVTIGDGTIVCAGAIVQPLVTVGRMCIINTAASVDHDCVLNDLVHVCPGARLAGTVKTGEGCWIGVGASVRDKLILGAWSLIGAGAAVVANVPDGQMVLGVPAKPRGRSPYARTPTQT